MNKSRIQNPEVRSQKKRKSEEEEGSRASDSDSCILTPDSCFSSLIPHPSGKSVTIFCDGSSLGNGQLEMRAAAVALLGYRGIWRGFGEFLGQATNQQAEIAAAALGLEALREPCRVRVVTDSRYVVETMEGRFRRKSNADWWARLDKAARPHKIEWEWAKGHAGHVIQEAADRAARGIAAAGRVDERLLRDAIDRIGVTELTE